jgi:WD40 repeat protein
MDIVVQCFQSKPQIQFCLLPQRIEHVKYGICVQWHRRIGELFHYSKFSSLFFFYKFFKQRIERIEKIKEILTKNKCLFAFTLISLSAHPGPVVSVEYDKETKILFSASGAFVRAWDLRDSNVRPIKTLCSSGVALSGAANLSSIPTGEAPITALRMGTNSGNLYTAASDKVRFWDLRMFSCIGKLSGGHQAAVMCLTSWNGPENTDYIATGSKDHYVKVIFMLHSMFYNNKNSSHLLLFLVSVVY